MLEVYDFREIRKTLERHGHHFKIASDTEVILNAYLQWGIDCLHRFVGMFALALWDGRKQCLFLARDRLGIKPLYYHFSRDTLLFVSELKAFMAFSAFNRDIDYDAIPLFLHYQYIPAPRTIFKHTYKLLPGYYGIYNGQELSSHRYWTLHEGTEEAGRSGLSEEQRLEELDDLLTRAVSDRLISDVPLGALLSGGIDSSVVVALMQKVSTTPTRTFSIGFREKGYNEVPWASKVARHLGTDHTEFYVTPRDAMEVIAKLPDMYDEPFADTSSLPTFLVCCLARSQVTVALSGDGGDEQFSGYVRYWSTKAMVENCRHLPTWVKRGLAVSLGAISTHWEAKDIIDFYFISRTVWKGSKENGFLTCYNMARKKEALLDDPAMTAYQIEELLNRVLSKKDKILPSMKKEIDWDSFEKDIRFYIDLTYSMQQW